MQMIEETRVFHRPVKAKGWRLSAQRAALTALSSFQTYQKHQVSYFCTLQKDFFKVTELDTFLHGEVWTVEQESGEHEYVWNACKVVRGTESGSQELPIEAYKGRYGLFCKGQAWKE